jgi:hypothetical protein
VAEADRKEGEKKIRLQEDEENRLAESGTTVRKYICRD